MNDTKSAAFSLLLSDLLENILARADNPKDCTAQLSGRIRDLIGVRSVFVFQCASIAPSHEHELLSVTPERRRGLAASEAMEKLLVLAHGLRGVHYVDPQADCACDKEPDLDAALHSALCAALLELQSGPSIFAPLRYGDKQMGLLLLLDILDEHNIATLTASLERLSGVLALILRNAFLYSDLERAVAERTKTLEQEQAKLRHALTEKDVLLKEVHHRVKNNLQIIDSLLHMQSERNEYAAVKQALAEGRGRVSSMAMVHEELYRSEDLSTIELERYLPKLVDKLFMGSNQPVRREFELEPLRVSLSAGIPIGLIVNEIVMNAIKYAFAERADGRLEMRLRREGALYRLCIKDDGPGLPPGLDPDAQDTLGMSIVRGLADQLGGQALWNSDTGLRFTLSIAAEGLTP
jgi:two-component sensor histidine kinase